jgi:hypothetical protein
MAEVDQQISSNGQTAIQKCKTTLVDTFNKVRNALSFTVYEQKARAVPLEQLETFVSENKHMTCLFLRFKLSKVSESNTAYSSPDMFLIENYFEPAQLADALKSILAL